AGYATALIGKWHLGFAPQFHPLKSGYQEFFGPLSGAVDYFTHCGTDGAHDLFDGTEEVYRKGYLTDVISERAAAWVGKQKGPFFLSLHYTAPHWPWETRDDEAESKRIAKIVHTDGGSVATYLRMIHHMDEGIGRVLRALQETGADRDTIVVFTSDNGGERFSDTWPLVGKKMDLLEGGIRVPYIVRWPARVKPGGVTAQHAITMDWVPTFLEAAGVSPASGYPLDGLSLLPALEGRIVERDLFWRMSFRQQRAVRSGRWKYLSVEGDEFLFDLETDARERANYRRREEKVFETLKKKYETWHALVPPIPADASVSVPYGKADLTSSAS
ncbi:MAG TPA: sulfatase-like hydrolase/transferase, partial [Burkholderiales bacterium]|nr:sulfatase-like hydrolase/transferase [Burkholderiales bacterium]